MTWTHPIHARGIRSPRLDVRGEKLLSDRQIHRYAKEGRYGTEVQAAALGNQNAKNLNPPFLLHVNFSPAYSNEKARTNKP